MFMTLEMHGVLSQGRYTLVVSPKLLALSLLVTTFFVASAAGQTTWKLVFNDEFNGPNGAAPDPSKWTYDTGGGGFGNGEIETYCAPGSNAAPCSSASPNIFQ